jgi:hypothetical protein
MGLFEDILDRHQGDKVAAAVEVGFGLMRGDPATHKAGYTGGNATLAVRDLYALTTEETDRVAAVLDPTGAEREAISLAVGGAARNRFSGPSREHDDAPGDDPEEV